MATDEPTTKVCTLCKIEKPATDFFIRRASPDGRRRRCKTCTQAYTKAYLKKHPEKRREYNQRAYIKSGRKRPKVIRGKNKELARLRRKRYYYADPEKERSARRAYYWKDPDRHRASSVECMKRLRDRLRAIHGKLPISAAQRAAQKKYVKRHPEKVAAWDRRKRASRRGAIGSHTAADVADIFRLQKGRCAYCRVFLKNKHVDHIVALSRGGSDNRRNLQLTCKPCNTRKWAKDPIIFARETGRLI